MLLTAEAYLELISSYGPDVEILVRLFKESVGRPYRLIVDDMGILVIAPTNNPNFHASMILGNIYHTIKLSILLKYAAMVRGRQDDSIVHGKVAEIFANGDIEVLNYDKTNLPVLRISDRSRQSKDGHSRLMGLKYGHIDDGSPIDLYLERVLARMTELAHEMFPNQHQ